MLRLPAWSRSLRFLLTAALALLWTLLFALSGTLAYRLVRRELVAAMGSQLASAAKLLASQLEARLPPALLEPGSRPEGAVATVLKEALSSGLAQDLVLISPRGLVLLDATGEAVPGFAAKSLSPGDWSELRAGRAVVHPPQEAGFGSLSQSAFAPLKNGAVLELRADPAYLAALSRFRAASLWALGLGLVLTVMIGSALAAWILSPVAWIERAARGESLPLDGGRDDELARAARAVAGSLKSLAQQSLEARLRRENAERRSEELRQVASAIAHEVRNPLAVIRGQADLLGRSLGPSSPALPSLDRIRGQVDQLDQVVNRFLELGRAPRLERRRLELEPLMHSLAEDLRHSAAPGQSVRLHCEPCPGTQADWVLLQGALLNLGLNGLQAMPQGGELTLSCRTEAGRALIEVRDAGPGLSVEARERLFQPFFTTKPGGSGLGLPLARRAALAHGGDLEVLDAPGHGALFRFWLPLSEDKA